MLGLLGLSLLQLGMSTITAFPKPCLTPLAHISCQLPHRSFANAFFRIRRPGITVSANVAQLLAFPAGKLLEAILPTRQFTTFGYIWSLNPGKFNLKEHIVITIMANVGFNAQITSDVCLLVIPPA